MNCQHHERNNRSLNFNLYVLILIGSLAWILSGCSSSTDSPAVSASENQPSETAIQPLPVNPLQAQPDQAQKQTQSESAAPAAQAQADPGSAAPIRQKQAAELAQATQAPVVEAAAPQASGPVAPTLEASPQEAQANGDLPPAEPKVGFLAPDISLTALDGSIIKLSDLRGKNVMISYWVTWCIPCREELPILTSLAQEYQDKNLVILTIDGIKQDDLGSVQQMVADLGLTNPVLLDDGEAFWNSYLVQFLPTSFFIDSQGIIRHIQLGSAPEDQIRAKVDQLINNQF